MDITDTLQRALGPGLRIERELGGGGMSRVFVARDAALDRSVVVKVLSPEASAAASLERFRREIQVLAKLQHPNVVPLLMAGEADGLLYYIMPYVAGDSLRARLSRDGALPLQDVVRIMRELLDALAFAHRAGVIHRDIKPENILLADGHAVVSDFGVAKALHDSATLTATGISMGTPAYMAPEQAAADSLLDHRADLYTAAVVAYEMLAGAPPFTGSAQQVITAHFTTAPLPIKQRRRDVPAPLADLVMRALAKDAAERPQTAAEMLAVLDSLVLSTGTAAKRTETIAALTRSRVTRVLAVALPLAIGTAFGAWQMMRPTVMRSAQIIAVLPLAVTGNDTGLARLAQNLATLVSNNLDGVGAIRTADPTSVLNHAHSKGAAITASDAIDIAKALGARSSVHGTMVRNGPFVRVDVILSDVLDPSTPIAHLSVSTAADSLAALTDSLTMGLLRHVWSRGDPPTPHVASITTHSPVALREFLDGERLFARGLAHLAGDAYKRAVHADTSFWFAGYRYRVARTWLAEPFEDTSITQRLDRHRSDLPERERALLATSDAAPSQSEYVRRLQALTARYPDYAPGWEQFADFSVHHAERSGRSVHDAIGMWQQVERLMPTDLPTVEHIMTACIASGDLACARAAGARFDTLVRRDPHPTMEMRLTQQAARLSFDSMSQERLDSIVRVGTRDSALMMFPPTVLVSFAPALVWQPRLFSYFDTTTRHLFAAAPKSVIGPNEVAAWMTTRAARGAWSALDSAIAMGIPETGRANRTSPTDLVRARVIAEIEGALAPSASTVQRMMARTEDQAVSPAARTEARWLIAANALVRGDSSVFRAQLAAVAGDTTAVARIAARSLRALSLGLSGRRGAAAESLLALERVHGEEGPKLWGAFAIDRLLGAQWLTESKRYAPADSLLEFTRGFIIWSTAAAAWPVFAAAQLQRSRTAEAMGNRDEAIRFATIFLRAYDLAPASQKPLIDEAQQRIARLGGKLDVRPSQSVP